VLKPPTYANASEMVSTFLEKKAVFSSSIIQKYRYYLS